MTKISNLTRTGALLLVFASLSSLSIGCNCPPARTPTTIKDSPQHLEAASTILRAATANRTWTDDDDLAFRQHLPQLSVETRLTLGKQLSSLITSGKVVIRHAPPAELPPPVCQCLAAQCTPAGTGGGTPASDTPPVIQVAPRAAEPTTPANSRKKQN